MDKDTSSSSRTGKKNGLAAFLFSSHSTFTGPLEELLARLGPNSVFGKPIQLDDVTVIPVAEVRTGFGMGFGGGLHRGQKAAEGTDENQGGGGGAGARMVPRGYIHVAHGEIQYKPIFPVLPLALAGMACTAWILSKLLKR